MTIEWYQLLLYAGAYALMVAAPGPFAAAVAARSAAFGFRSGLALALGTWLGEKVWMLVAIFGLAVIAAQYESLLVILKYVGAAWLCWLGLQLLFGDTGVAAAGVEARHEPFWRGLVTRAMINLDLGNPKDALFFLVLFPGFFNVAAMTWVDAVLIIAISTPIGLGFDLGYAYLGSKARVFLGGTRLARRIDRITGGMLTGAGVAIAAS